MQFSVLHLACILLSAFPIARGKIQIPTFVSTEKYPTKDGNNLISQSHKNSEQRTGTNIRLNDENIVCNIGYRRIEHIYDVWGKNKSVADYSTGIFLVDYKTYADSFDDFVGKYPSVTIMTAGEAVSTDTFGDVGKGKFGPFTYSTRLFSADKVHYEVLVKAYKEEFDVFEVSVNIGIGFKSDGTTLQLAPYIDGYIDSRGSRLRELNFGLGVSEVIFNPKPPINDYETILIK